MRLSSLLSCADWVLGDIVHAVEHDPALTGRLLQLANSARLAGAVAIDTVSDAILRVGPGPLLSLALGSAVRLELLKPLEAYGLEERQLWRHSVASALAVERSRQHCRTAPPTGAFVAALLHDIGKLILDRHLTAEDATGGAMHLERETELLGANHSMIGGMIASHWKLSEPVTNAIAHHHDPSVSDDEAGRLTASFVCLANAVAHRIEEPNTPAPSRFVLDTVRIDAQGFERICEETQAALEEMLSIYG